MKQLSRIFGRAFRFMKSDEASWVIAPYLPCTTMNNVWRALDKKGGSVLDVGGGKGRPMRFLIRKCGFRFTVNVDCSLHRLKEAKEKRTHDEYILCDVRFLPFKGNSFDIVLCLDLLEHLEKEAGYELLLTLEKIARKQIVLATDVNTKTTPVPEKRIGRDIDHVYSWRPSEFKRLGYKVRGSSFPQEIIGKRPFYVLRNNPLFLIERILSVVAGPFVYFFPSKGGHQTAVKFLNRSK